MGFFDFLKKQKTEPVVAPAKVKPVAEPVKQKHIELSMLELRDVDWEEFGSRLKKAELLPHSYSATPINVKVSLSADNHPYAILTFESDTISNTRKIEVYDSCARRAGKSFENSESVGISNVWKDFQYVVRCAISLNRRKEIIIHKRKAQFLQGIDGNNQELIETLNSFDKFFEEEDKFLETYKNVTFDILSYHGKDEGIPAFSKYTGVGSIGKNVTPRSPKALELCVSRLAEEEKRFIANDLERFREKCQQIEATSPYVTIDWQRTVDILCDMIVERSKHTESQQQHFENGQERI